MKKIILFINTLLVFSNISFGSFPISTNLQINDTIINSKNPVKIQVDSLSKYPIENETLTEYRERLKRNGIKSIQSSNSASQRMINSSRSMFIWAAILLGIASVWLISVASKTIDCLDTNNCESANQTTSGMGVLMNVIALIGFIFLFRGIFKYFNSKKN